MRYYVPGSLIQRAVESVGSQLGDTLANIPDMLRMEEERARRRKLEDEDRISRNSQIEWQRRREATQDSRADTLFNQDQKDYQAQAPVRERTIREGSISSNFKNRRTSILNSLSDPEYTDLGQFVAGAGDDEADFNARMGLISDELKKRAAAKARAEEQMRIRIASVNRPPDPFELYRKKALFDTATDLHGQGLTPKNIDQIEQANKAPATLGDWASKLGSTFPVLQPFLPEVRTAPVDPELQSTIDLARKNPYFGVPAQTRRSEEVRMELQRAQAERATRPNEAQLARIDLRKREQVNRALELYNKGALDDRTFHAQLKSLGLTTEEIISLFEGPPDSP
jgi:hypothetical protein